MEIKRGGSQPSAKGSAQYFIQQQIPELIGLVVGMRFRMPVAGGKVKTILSDSFKI
jgi:hypothetical protein